MKKYPFYSFPTRARPPARSLLFPFHDASFVTTRRWKSAEICERVEITVISFLCYIFVLFNTFLTGLRVLFYAFYTFTRIAENLRCSFGERSKLSLCFCTWLINWKNSADESSQILVWKYFFENQLYLVWHVMNNVFKHIFISCYHINNLTTIV